MEQYETEAIIDPTDFNSKHIQEIEAVIASFGVQLSSFIIRNVSDIERAIDGFAISHTAD